MSAGTSSWAPRPTGPYHPDYQPFNWRGWLDFGTGALGDMACHTINIACMALELFDPESVEVIDTSGIVDHETYPALVDHPHPIRPAQRPRSADPDLVRWRRQIPREQEGLSRSCSTARRFPTAACCLVGEKGSFFSQNDYGAEHVLLPREKFKDYQKPKPILPRSPGHFTEFVEAIKSGEPTKAMSNFDYAGRLTETVLLGIVALKTGSKIEWDPVALKARNCSAADQYIRRDYRKGFSIH